MFYSSNDNYMQDLYFYNQTPNMNTYNPNMNGMQNANMMNNVGGMYMGQNINFANNNQNQVQNINALYPSIYRIILPVVSRVIANSNYQFLNEDVVNNMVDTVYNIVEGQIDYDEDDKTPRASTQTDTTSASSSSNNSSTTNSSNTTTRTTDNRQITQTTTTTRNNRNDSLLRDIIKILILRELISRSHMQNQMQNNQQFSQMPYYQGQNCNMNF